MFRNKMCFLLMTIFFGAIIFQALQVFGQIRNLSSSGAGNQDDRITIRSKTTAEGANFTASNNTLVRFSTNLGNIDVKLLPNIAPLTVANFLGYVNRGDYTQSFIHRLVPNFVLQGGGYKYVSGQIQTIPEQSPIVNEFNISNTRGTLAMAKLGGNPNSATNQWFFNLADNSASLDTQNGGYTVFGRVINANSLTVMDAIAALQTVNAGGVFDQLPVINYTSGPIQESNLVTLYSITVLPPSNIGAGQFDFDGDGKTDLSIFRPTPGEWWINRSSNGSTFAFQFGASSDKIVPADYTGDGKTDVAFWRPSSGNWYILRSEDSSFYSFPFGASGDVPVPADFDADGKTDAAVFRPSTLTWYINKSSGGTIITTFGAAGDVPVVADYDGDGKSDIAIYRSSLGQWWIQRSTAGTVAFTFGNSTDKPVQGDYTGDGKADVAFFRPSTGEWFILRSENQSYYSFPFGTNGDIPAPGEYDGDGRFDATVFRPSNNSWYSQRTSAGILIQTFGINGDKPVPNAFIP